GVEPDLTSAPNERLAEVLHELEVDARVGDEDRVAHQTAGSGAPAGAVAATSSAVTSNTPGGTFFAPASCAPRSSAPANRGPERSASRKSASVRSAFSSTVPVRTAP